jgi:hypothetical protein
MRTIKTPRAALAETRDGSQSDRVGPAIKSSDTAPSKSSQEQPPPSGWRARLAIHPAAGLFPPMSEAELSALTTDIQINGLRNKVDIYFDPNTQRLTLIDGRNRFDALELLDAEIFGTNGRVKSEYGTEFIVRDDTPPEVLIARTISMNIRRRHLKAKERRELIGKLLALDPERSDRSIAKEIGSDHKTVGTARASAKRRGAIPHVAKHRDTKGRKQPARKKARPFGDGPSAAKMSLEARREIKSVLDHWLCELTPEHLREITGYFVAAVAKLNSESAGGES